MTLRGMPGAKKRGKRAMGGVRVSWFSMNGWEYHLNCGTSRLILFIDLLPLKFNFFVRFCIEISRWRIFPSLRNIGESCLFSIKYQWHSSIFSECCVVGMWIAHAFNGNLLSMSIVVCRFYRFHIFTVRMDEGRLRKVRRGKLVAEKVLLFLLHVRNF